jgi:hypothetical protein
MTNTTGPMPTAQFDPHYVHPGQTYPQPGMISPPAGGYPYPGGATMLSQPAHDPGRTLGIVGLVLAPFAGLVGLILSLVAFRRSRRAVFTNRPAIAGAVVGGIATIAVLASIVVGALAIGGVVDACHDLGPGQHVVNGVTYTCA